MTRQSTKQRGVTLIEVMLTLAISALLLSTVLVGRNSLRSQAQFADGMERIKETILSVKSDANTSNNATGTGKDNIAAGTPSYLTVGRVIHFKVNTNKADIATLLCGTNADLECNNKVNLTDAKTITLPWGITYDGDASGVMPDQSIIFARSDTTGEFNGYSFGGVLSSGGPLNTYINSANQSAVTLNFSSPDGRRATIEIDPSTGAVTRRMR